MKTEEEIKKELKIADQYHKLVRNALTYHNSYYSAGYKTALEVVLGLRESEFKEKIKEFVDFDLMKQILEDTENE